MNYGKWVTSSCEEYWGGSEEYDTKEQAVANAPNDLNLESGEGFWVGRMDKPKLIFPNKYFFDQYFESLTENSNEETLGEWSEGWVSGVEQDYKLKDFFEKKMTEVEEFILENHKFKFFMAGNVEHITAP